MVACKTKLYYDMRLANGTHACILKECKDHRLYTDYQHSQKLNSYTVDVTRALISHLEESA